MKTPAIFISLLLLTLMLAVSLVQAQGPGPQGDANIQATLGTAFTYQGRLRSGGESVTGACDLQFSLWDAASGGAQIGTTQTKTSVAVSDGYFTIPDLDFGAGAFQGDARWLAVAVRCPAGGGTYTPLTPRQPLTAAPYALFSKAAPWGGLTSVPAGFADGVDNDTTYTAGTGLTLTSGQFSVNFAGSGAATTVARSDHTHDTAYWRLIGNSGTNPTTHFLGTTDNQALELRVNNARALRLEPNATSPNVVGGYSGNSVTGGVYGAAIGGGGAAGSINRVTDNYGTVGGGLNNRAGDNAGTTSDQPYATVGGGVGNTASGYAAIVGGGYENTANGSYTTVGGGRSNTASSGATIGGGWYNTASGTNAIVSGGQGNTASGHAATVGGGHVNAASGPYATVGGGMGNAASDDAATVGGGAGNTASGSEATISGGWDNTASGWAATVGGGRRNIAEAAYATIAGGGPSNPSDPTNTNNRVTDDYGTISGGANNRAGNGDGDTTNARYATVGGGVGNSASSQAATVGGGVGNSASSQAATVGGGQGNTASGNAATVPGGADNIASGAYSFAAGAQAQATHHGSFVWSSAAATSSWGDNTFTVRAHGGARFYSAAGTTTGVQLASGSGSWSNLSDRAVKENFAPVDGRDILARLAAIPITTWNYRSQDPAIRHIGPVAQDFYAAFGVGEDDTHISTVDADGVALAAIQGLYQLSQEKDARIAQLEGRVTALEAQNAAQQVQIDDLQARLTALEGRSGHSSVLASALPISGLALGGLALLGAVVYGRRKEGSGQ